MHRGKTIVGVLVGVVLIGAISTACSTSTESGGESSGTTAVGGGGSTVSTVARPEGPAADLSTEITGSAAPFVGSATPPVIPEGYVEQEYVAAGTATDYTVSGSMTGDGQWTFETDTEADYRTRVLIRRPADPEDFSGTVVVEWLNVSGGVDADVEYSSTWEEITRSGDAWVGVSAQRIGVEGGPVLVTAPGGEGVIGKGLKVLDPERYGSLAHPGDGYSFDIYTQVARAVRANDPALGGLEPQVLLAAGESQSAIALTTYYNGVQPLTDAFDGFFIHSRAYAPLPLVGPGEAADLAGAMGAAKEPVIFRTDTGPPVLDIQTEGDVVGVLNSVDARQPDSDRFRLWEIAGGADADIRVVGETIAPMMNCGAEINTGPTHLVAKAALRSLDTWVRTGDAPPTFDLIEVTDDTDVAIVRDADGIAVGGVRTPPVDVPVDVLSGAPGPSEALICILSGTTIPLPAERIAELYPTQADYVQRYAASADGAIEAGVVLMADRDALIDYSDPSRVTG